MMKGRTIKHYEVGDLLGSGGMGAVYRARDTRLGRDVALKILLPEGDDSGDRRSRLLREARAASSLSSSNIASIFDIGEVDGAPFIVMEYVQGEALACRIARGPIPPGEAIPIAMQVAEALEDAHARGIVHRDIKSANIMVDPRGRVKVLDFGLAKVLEPALEASVTYAQTQAGAVLGTFSYMAPEQALGREIDARADLFSLGAVIYEMLTGRRPFEGATAAAILDATLHQQPTPPSRLTPALPVSIDTLVLKALAKDPAFRYQTARDLYIDLRAAAQELSISQALSASGLNRLAVAGLTPPHGQPGAAMATPAAGTRSVAVVGFANITREPADEWLGSGLAETLTTDLKLVRGLTVIGRAQVFDVVRMLGGATPAGPDDHLASEIGRRVGAAYIVSGGYQRLADRVRITAQLMEVATGQVIRTVKVDGRVDDIFSLQDRLVVELSEGLRVSLHDSEIEAIEQPETTSLEAYEAYSQGMMNVRIASPSALDRAAALFERAIALDPSYAEAWAALGNVQQNKGMFLAAPELSLKGLESLRRAITLKPGFAQAHHQLGSVLITLGHHEEAIPAIREALRLDPTTAGAHSALGRALWFGRGDFTGGITELEHAVELNPDAGYPWLQLSLLYSLTGDPVRGEEAARRAVVLQERAASGTEGLQTVGARIRLGYALYRQGRYDEAIAEYERELEFLTSSDHILQPRTHIEGLLKLAAARWRNGDRARADKAFEEGLGEFNARLARGADDGATRYYVAAAFGLRENAGDAAAHLRASLRTMRTLNLARFRIDPDFDPVRSEPALAAVVA